MVRTRKDVTPQPNETIKISGNQEGRKRSFLNSWFPVFLRDPFFLLFVILIGLFQMTEVFRKDIIPQLETVIVVETRHID